MRTWKVNRYIKLLYLSQGDSVFFFSHTPSIAVERHFWFGELIKGIGMKLSMTHIVDQKKNFYRQFDKKN